MATIAQLLKMPPKVFKEECNRVQNRIRSIERSQSKKAGIAREQELSSLKDYTKQLDEAIRQWFKGSLPT